jgi:hypothetical protein
METPTPIRRIVTCELGGESIDTDATTTYQYVGGWARNRTQGGTNALALRRPERRWACNVCIDKLTSGVAVGQADLFG